MLYKGFYEINRWSADVLELPVMAMPGNMWHIMRHWQDGIEVYCLCAVC